MLPPETVAGTTVHDCAAKSRMKLVSRDSAGAPRESVCGPRRSIRPSARESTRMKSSRLLSVVGAVISSAPASADAQAPAQTPGAGQQPAYAVASPPVTSPLSAPAGKDSGAIRTALPNGVNQGPFDPATWKYGPAFNAPAGAKIWNPVKAKMMAGQKVSGGTLFNVTDPTVYCSLANAGYDFIWTEMQHSSVTWDQVGQDVGRVPLRSGGAGRARRLHQREGDPARARQRRAGRRRADRRYRRRGHRGPRLGVLPAARPAQPRRRLRVRRRHVWRACRAATARRSTTTSS